jgi:hypothetical protein
MRRLALVLLVAAGLAGCAGGAATTGPPAPPAAAVSPLVGTYVLQTMDGVAVPGLYFLTDSYRFDVMSGAFELLADGTYRIVLSMRYVGVEGVRESPAQEFERGTYSASGTVLTLRSEAGVTMSATVANAQLTMRMDGLSFMYRKS